MASASRQLSLPLLEAAEQGDEETVLQLLRSNTDPNLTGVGGRTALHFATPFWRLARTLVNGNAFIDAIDSLGSMPLHIAARDDRIETVQLLLSGKGSCKAPCSVEHYMW